MINFIDQLEQVNINQTTSKWKGTFRDFLKHIESGKYPNIGASSHQRIEAMILSYGTEKKDYFGKSRISYKFFEDKMFGMEEVIDQIMAYIHSAARKTETSRRMLMVYGPPSAGKSDLVTHMKRGLEKFSRTDEGAIFALSDSRMFENPFLLVPDDIRPEFEKNYNIKIEGKLTPHSAQRLEKEFGGRFLEYPVERIFMSEEFRVGIGTWLPSDRKGQDLSELVGGIDFSKIQEYGDESDPRTYVMNGELNVANRGLMEFIEGLKAGEEFLRVLLTATQEKAIKAPRFGLISIDSTIFIHSNEEEFKNFMAEKKYEAYHDRMVIVRATYNSGIKNEVGIYKKLLSDSDLAIYHGKELISQGRKKKEIHLAPNTLESAAMFSVLTRLQNVDGELNLVKKMKLYDNQHVKGFKPQQVFDLKKSAPREGMFGVSPRFIIDQINGAIATAIEEQRSFVTPLDVLRQLISGIGHRDTFSKEEKNRYSDLVDMSRNEWNDLLRNDIQKAFFLSFEEEARVMCENYLIQIDMALSNEKPKDPVTGEEMQVDEKLLNSIESHLSISSSGKDDFRNEVLRFFGDAARKNKKVDYTEHSMLREAIQKSMFEERKGTIRMTVSSRNPDPESLRRLNDVIDRMVEHQGYTAASANELLKYATARLFDK